MDILLIGNQGLIGNYINTFLIEKSIKFNVLNNRLNDDNLYKLIDNIEPKYIICAAGLVGKPNRDYCNYNPVEAINTNTIYHYKLAKYCNEKSIKICFFSTIGIYNSYFNNIIYNETDLPNNLSDVYLQSKYLFELLTKEFNNVLILRLGHVLVLSKNNKNLLTKIINFKKVHNEKMSISILNQLFEHFIFIIQNYNNIINFVSPEYISLSDILDIYKNKIDNNYNYEIINYESKFREISRVNYTKLQQILNLESVYNYLKNNIYYYNNNE